LPGFSQLRVWHIGAADECVHHRLIPSAAELDDQIVDDRREPQLTDEREAKGVCLTVAVQSLTQRDDLMRPEGVKDAGYRLDPDR
jgi:hypothetical protein